MELGGLADPADALARAARLVQIPAYEVLPSLSEILAGPLPHRAVAQLSTQSATSRVFAVGERALTRSISGTELGPLLGLVTAGRPWQGTAEIGGVELPVLAANSDYAPRGALLAFVLHDDTPIDPAISRIVQEFWDMITSHVDRLAVASAPTLFAQSRAVAAARGAAVAELTEAHAAALTGLTGVLRSRRIENAQARSTALDLAVNALVELRTEAQRELGSVGEEEPVSSSFQRLAESLNTLVRHSLVRLELAPPVGEGMLPSDTAHAARVAVRAVALAVLHQDGVQRLRVGWQVDGGELRAVLRDDGPGEIPDELGMVQIAERLRSLSGRLDVDAVLGWGTTYTVTLPVLHPTGPGAPRSATSPRTATAALGKTGTADALAKLGERELEVLERLALGQRNRAIAQMLHIGESTVKFHVTNILAKLGVGSRGEAAALFHDTMTS